MPASREWTEWHLTPRGWISGSTRREGQGNAWRDEPEDRVLTYVYKEQRTSANPAPQCGVEESWRSKTATNIDALLAEFGPCPPRL